MLRECYQGLKSRTMPKLKNSQHKFDSQHRELAEATIALQRAKARLERNASAIAKAKSLNQQERAQKLVLLIDEREKINNEISRLTKKVKVVKRQILDSSNNLQVDPTKSVEELSDEYPILMFPLRL